MSASSKWRPSERANDHAGNDANAETNGQRFGGALSHDLLHFDKPISHRGGGLWKRFLNGLRRMLDTGANRLTSTADGRGAIRTELLEKMLDAFSRRPCFSLDRTHQLIHIPIEDFEVVIRERAPLAPQLPLDLVPISHKRLLVNHGLDLYLS